MMDSLTPRDDRSDELTDAEALTMLERLRRPPPEAAFEIMVEYAFVQHRGAISKEGIASILRAARYAVPMNRADCLRLCEHYAKQAAASRGEANSSQE